MSELISGKEALIALVNGDEVLYINTYYKEKPTRYWGDAKECTVEQFLSGDWLFRLKPRTIVINGINVPAPFEPKDGDRYWYITDSENDGYDCSVWMTHNLDDLFIGVWRSKDEVKQVIAALRNVFKGD